LLLLAVAFIAYNLWILVALRRLQHQVAVNVERLSRLAKIDKSLDELNQIHDEPVENAENARQHAEALLVECRAHIEAVPGDEPVEENFQEALAALHASFLRLDALYGDFGAAQHESDRKRLRAELIRERRVANELVRGIVQNLNVQQAGMSTELTARWRVLAFLMQGSCILAATLAFLLILYRRDLGLRKQAEADLRLQEARLRLLVEQMPAFLWTLDAAERITSCQGKGMVDLDLRVGQHLVRNGCGKQRSHATLFPPIDPCRQALSGNVFTGQVAVGERAYEMHVKPLRTSTGTVTGCIGVALDVTARTRAEETLLQRQALLRGLLDSIPDLIFYKGADGAYLGCNKAFEHYVGRSEECLRGSKDQDLFPDDANRSGTDGARCAPGEGHPGRSEACLCYPDGRTVLAEVLETPFFGRDGKVLGLIGLSRDITERRRLEEQVHQAGKMEALGQLAGGIAHDFNNLLTAILGNLSLIPRQLPDGHPARELTSVAESAALRAADLTRQLLGFSRRTPLQPQPANLNCTIAEVVGILGRTMDPRIAMDVQADPRLWTVKADPGQMSQVLMNLCINARDAMPNGGRLVLETANLILTPDYTRLNFQARPGEFVRLEVRDSGCGMTPEVQARIFEPFFTTKGRGKGTGLGLALVFGIVQQHDGWVECHSAPGSGTTFTLYLPRIDVPVAPAIPQSELAPERGRETILLVDDEEAIRCLGRSILEKFGYEVLLASDGKEAVELYRREQERIDLVLLDLRMPRMSGHDAFQQMLQINPDVPVVVVSGFSDQYITEADQQRIRGFLGKPFLPDELARIVRTALNGANCRQKSTRYWGDFMLPHGTRVKSGA